MPNAPDHLLPRQVEPERYELTLRPDLEAAAFSGDERVQVTIVEPVDEIVLHAADLVIDHVRLVGPDGRSLAGTVQLDEALERATIALEATAEPGRWVLELSFRGTLNDQLRGFYRSTFVDASGATKTIATTQFEATDARRAFPCWDEPDRKSVFAVTLVVERGLLAVSNAPVHSQVDDGDGTTTIVFDDTMKMSTYLVAFIVGPLTATEPIDVDGVPLRVVCVPGKERLTAFALEVGAHALRFFRRYFDIAYPGGKLDLLALPDFAMGAMENLGAVTFRESLLLIDPNEASRLELERVADVIAHELAHMWFGDLVTMKWWNGIWLNEAFATFMELLCVDDFRPDWDRWTSFGTSRGVAMVVDGLASTRAIEFPVTDPREAEQMFDVLTYQKGAGVLRMLERYLGAEAFQRGIAGYIAKHSYANTETADLWDALEQASGEPVRAMMDTWILQGGHPLVSASTDEAGALVLEQRRFRYRPDADDDQVRWQVPLIIRSGAGGANERQRVLLETAATTVPVNGGAGGIVVNDGGWGTYRTRYDGALLERLLADVPALAPLERFVLVSDTLAAVQAGLSPLTDWVRLVRLVAAGGDGDANVWSEIVDGLHWIDRASDSSAQPAVEAFTRSLLQPLLGRLGWQPAPGEPDPTRSLRASAIATLGGLGHDEEVRARAATLLAAALAERGAVDPDVAGAVVSVVAATGVDEAYATFLERWRNPATPQEELRYLYALAGFQHPSLVQGTFDLARTEVRSQNAPFVIARLLAGRESGAQTWPLVTSCWDELNERFPANLLDRMLEGVLSLTAPDQAADVHAFIAAHPVPSRQRSVEQLLERLDVAVAFRQRLGASVATALAPA